MKLFRIIATLTLTLWFDTKLVLLDQLLAPVGFEAFSKFFISGLG